MEKENSSQYKKGLWTVEEDKMLTDYVKVHGKGQWNRIAKKTGKLRWMNYLSPTVNRSNFTEQEEDLIIRLHNLLGNRWSLIAKRVPGRTDNQVKNYWNTHLRKKHQTRTSFIKVDHHQSVVTQEITSTANCHDQNKATQKVAAVLDTQEYSIMDDGFFNSLWVSDDDLLHIMHGFSFNI
ncbi:hypothetical protein EZV62_019919 [Acer yangbiense]|uniref:Uncharacterized protein n=1 Tax=Acer yangbiense TaxID=1000413 RepID=A0A5C7HC18_9ROSI|nr:hypothetical protein EZV62_019919 [Acer yangbiense]